MKGVTFSVRDPKTGKFVKVTGVTTQPYNDAAIKEAIAQLVAALEQETTRAMTAEKKNADAIGQGGGALQLLYESVEGVTYNAATGFYEVYKSDGGLDDVTEEQMAAIYNAGHTWAIGSMADQKIPIPLQDCTIKQTDCIIDFSRLFARSAYRVIVLSPYGLRPSKMDKICENCKTLKRMTSYINCERLTSEPLDPFTACTALTRVHLRKLKTSVSLKDSPLLTVDDYTDTTADADLSTIGCLVKFAENTAPIVVRVHPTVLGKIPPTLQAKATAKNISFTK